MASWSKPWKGRCQWSTQRALASWERSRDWCGFKILRRLATCTKSRRENAKWTSTGPSRWGKQSTRWPSCGFYSCTTTVWRCFLIGEILSWSRWILTAYILRYRMILWKKWCVWSCGTSSKHAEKGWFTWDKWSVREPGLVKLEFKGTRMIALCSIRYYGEGDNETGKVN